MFVHCTKHKQWGLFTVGVVIVFLLYLVGSVAVWQLLYETTACIFMRFFSFICGNAKRKNKELIKRDVAKHKTKHFIVTCIGMEASIYLAMVNGMRRKKRECVHMCMCVCFVEKVGVKWIN